MAGNSLLCQPSPLVPFSPCHSPLLIPQVWAPGALKFVLSLPPPFFLSHSYSVQEQISPPFLLRKIRDVGYFQEGTLFG